ncbi:MAG TPA: CBS domain-containing protein, partial [Hyphomicrobiaceae bacterium]|nr:CBS domain-containing protein [Hyphomicrobiaceae bacterium]
HHAGRDGERPVGDLRRHMGPNLVTRTTREIMTRNPKTTSPDSLASAALEMMNASRITALFVVKDGHPIGVVHVHDFLRAGIV